MPGRSRSGHEAGIADRLIAGDPAALAEVYDQYSPSVYSLALRVSRNAAAAENITSDVFLWLWQHPNGFDASRGSLQAWLNVVTHRRAVEGVRHQRSVVGRTANGHAPTPGTVPDIADVASSVVTAQLVLEALDDLLPDERLAIELAYFGGETYRRVAEQLGIPEATAKSYLRRGLGKLAESLRAEGVGPWCERLQ